ncbi:MAG: 30S ribosomal protein S16 [Candidatus Pacebacteria bacterium]|nr:30S ribosomal protein S16 [Candidatus Paceibacterota bacterium]
MLKIRLQRVGKKHDPSFRVILIDSRKGPKSGSFIENLGFYDAIRKVKQIKADRIKHWIANGAQVSDTVHNILVSEKVIEGKKKNVLPKKSPIIKEKEEVEITGTADEAEVSTEEVKEAPVEEVKEEKAVEEVKEEMAEETPVVEEVAEAKEDVAEKKEETVA